MVPIERFTHLKKPEIGITYPSTLTSVVKCGTVEPSARPNITSSRGSHSFQDNTGLLGLVWAKASCVDSFNSVSSVASALVEVLHRDEESEVDTYKETYNFDDNDKRRHIAYGMMNMLRHAWNDYTL